MPTLPKPDDETKAFFRSVVPEEPDIQVRPMFGNAAAFVNGNMFAGLFGQELFVRVSGSDREELSAAGGGSFEPMPGRPMMGYTTLPESWRRDEAKAHDWILRALESARALPPKQSRSKKSPKSR
jgi:TfoX/Sxy family transcriptional regulator of competence genes